GQLEVMILNSHRVQRPLGGLAREMQSEPGLVTLRAVEFPAVARIVHLEHDHRTGGNFLRGARGKHVDALARRVAGEEQPERVAAFACAWSLERGTAVWRSATVVDHRGVGFYLEQRAVAIENIALHKGSRAAFALLELRDHLRSLDERDHVMNDLAIAGKNLGCCHPLVFFEVRRNDKVLNRVRHSRRDLEFLPEVEHRVGLSKPPAVSGGELRYDEVLRVAFFGALIDPRDDSLNIVLGEP